MAQGGGTPAGTAKVITQSLVALPPDQKPAWMEGKTEKEIRELVTEAICEAVEASYVVKDYIDSERAKGRDFDDIYSEVQPYLDYVSRPIGQEQPEDGAPRAASPGAQGSRDGSLGRSGGQRPPNPEEEAARREARRKAAPHRNLRAWPEQPN